MRVAAIIPTYRRDLYLVRTLRDLLQQTRCPDEVIVVDQTPEELRAEPARRALAELAHDPRVKVVPQRRAHVYEARNLAASVARADVLLYLDDDVIVHPALIQHHVAHYEDGPVDAVVGSIVAAFDAPLDPVPSGFEALAPEVQAYTYKTAFARELTHIAFMYAGNFSIRKRALARLGGWDEHVLTYGDRDLGIRLARQGMRMDYDPHAKLIHLAAPMGGTRLTDPRSEWKPWARCVSVHMLAWRHLSARPLFFVRYGLYRAARMSFLLKRNLLRPGRLPGEMAGYLRALVVGYSWAREGVKCSHSLE